MASVVACSTGGLVANPGPADGPPGVRGQYVAFVASVRPEDRWNDGLFVMRPDGSGLKLLDENVTTSFSWAPDGRRLAYSRAAGHEEGIYVADVQTATVIRLTRTSGWDGDPVWSPTGRLIAYVHDHDNVCVADLERGVWRVLNRTNGRVSNLAWSSDGRHLYFRGEDRSTRRQYADVITSDWHLYRVDIGSGDQERLWPHDGILAYPAPDGREIAAVLDHEGERRLYLADPATRILKRFDIPGFSPEEISWFSTGRRLIVEALPAGETSGLRGAALLLVDLDAGTVTVLVATGVEWGTSSWSGDGTHVGFTRGGMLVVLRIETRHETLLRRGSSFRWSP